LAAGYWRKFLFFRNLEAKYMKMESLRKAVRETEPDSMGWVCGQENDSQLQVSELSETIGKRDVSLSR
jgi:hypothetical protein